jgi:hypothetical protein
MLTGFHLFCSFPHLFLLHQRHHPPRTFLPSPLFWVPHTLPVIASGQSLHQHRHHSISLDLALLGTKPVSPHQRLSARSVIGEDPILGSLPFIHFQDMQSIRVVLSKSIIHNFVDLPCMIP